MGEERLLRVRILKKISGTIGEVRKCEGTAGVS
jgi:hypothetical protein